MRHALQSLHFSEYCSTLMRAVYRLMLPRLTPQELKELEIIFQEKKEQSIGTEREAYDYLLAAVRSFLPVFKGRKND